MSQSFSQRAQLRLVSERPRAQPSLPAWVVGMIVIAVYWVFA